MATEIQYKPAGRTLAFGAIGGFAAALVMAPLLMATAMVAGMPADAVPMAMGMMFGASPDNALMTGMGMHLIAGTIIGVIFGAIVGYVKKLRITNFGKGIAEGVIAGMISFAVLFIPVSMAAMPPILMNMMMQTNPGMNQEQLMSMMQQGVPAMMGMSVLSHIVYGAILGAVTSVLVLKTGGHQKK